MTVLRNISKRTYMHVVNGNALFLNPGEEKDIPDNVAQLWLKSSDEIIKGADNSKDEEIERLKKELQERDERDALIAEAKALKVKGVYNPNTSIETLRQKVAEAKAQNESTAKAEEVKAEEVKAEEVKTDKVEGDENPINEEIEPALIN